MKKLLLAVLAVFVICHSAYSLVPIDNVLARFGLRLSQRGYASRYTLEKDGNKALFGPGISQVIINGNSYSLDGVPVFRNGSLQVPERFALLMRDHFIRKSSAFWQTVTLDPGHGGRDPGAISPINGLQEKDVVLEVAKYARDVLVKAGVKVVMTRDKDIFIPLESRANTANTSRSNLFVSIHANYIEAPSITGVEVFYGDDWPKSNIDCSTRAYFLAGRMDLNHFIAGSAKRNFSEREEAFFFKMMLEQANEAGKRCARIVARTLADGLQTDNRGIKTKNLRVIRRAFCPAILVEIGFLSNRYEARKLKESSYRRKAGEKIAEGILDYLKREEKKK